MNTLLVTIDPNCEQELGKYGTVTFKSTLLEGFFIIETTYTKKQLEKLNFVKKVEENRIGHFCNV